MLQALLNLFPHEDIGWKEINETFIRYTLLKTPWFRVYIHRLIAVTAHPQCHNHPWSFVAFILKGGYYEYTEVTEWVWRNVGSVLLRPAEWTHNVTTKADGMWSLVITGPKSHQWGFKTC
jgi:hypothetical protein